jgi:CheY-like chemotaxis protein
MMGGEIGVVTSPAIGSTFWFTARFDKGSEPVTTAFTGESRGLDNVRALVVDDNATNRKILAQQLTSWRMIHAEAEAGDRALSMLIVAAEQGQPYDVVILDQVMPGMSGLELAREIKSRPAISAAGLILLTSIGFRGGSSIAREAGIAQYLTKPIRQSQLFDSLMTLVNGTSGSGPQAKPTQRGKEDVAEVQMAPNLILVAEDNIVNQKVAIRQLKKLGFRADAVANGREAIEALKRIPYDLIFMDCQMPDMDGYEATTEIRHTENGRGHTPIVAMTAHALEGDREKCLNAGMDDYITKPVQIEELSRVLDAFLRKGHQEKLEPALVG